MELRQLVYFTSIAEHGSISAAARALHMSQPPLSYAIDQLEAEIGVKLFVRSVKGIVLTPAGQLFYQRANDILLRSDSAIREVSHIADRRTFRIGLTPTVIPVLARSLCQLEKKDHSLQLEIHEGNTYALKEQLDDGTIDAAVIRTPVNLQGCRYRKIMDEPMAAVFQKSRKKKTIALKELSGIPLIVYRRYEPLITETFQKHALELNIICECDDARTALQFAADGLGTAIVPMTIAGKEKDLCIAEIQAKELHTSILLAWHHTKPIIDELIEIVNKNH
jgi:DNA-binding transcriptional LysR family regulator